MKKARTYYDKSFKEMAVQLCLSGKKVSEVARDLNVRSDMLSRWKREYKKYGTNSFSGKGNTLLTDQERQLAELKKQVRELKIERDILKKAVSIFSREPHCKNSYS